MVSKSLGKIVRLSTLIPHLKRLRKQGREIAFTNGCFDILHYGHVCYLQAAKKRTRVLVVGLNSDASVRKIKGPQRPLNPQRARAAVLAALECVDFIVIFDEETPYRLIEAVRPDILVKGSDWKGKEVVGRDIVEAYGGRVELIRYETGFSTTRVIREMQGRS